MMMTQLRAVARVQDIDDVLPEILMDACPYASTVDTHLTLASVDGDFSEFWDHVVRRDGVPELADGMRIEVSFHAADVLLARCSGVVGFKVGGRDAIIVVEV